MRNINNGLTKNIGNKMYKMRDYIKDAPRKNLNVVELVVFVALLLVSK